MRRAGQGLRGSAAAAAGGSALPETGLLRPTDRPCARRFAGDRTADGVSCPLRREHLFIRSQVLPGRCGTVGGLEGRSGCCSSAMTGRRTITTSRSRTSKEAGSHGPGCRRDWRASRGCMCWWLNTRRPSGLICRQNRSRHASWSASRPTEGRGSLRWSRRAIRCMPSTRSRRRSIGSGTPRRGEERCGRRPHARRDRAA